MSDGARRRGEGALARREKRLAYSLLLPTFALVLGVILLPLLANFWISFKPVTLADLRPPQLIVKEQLRGKLAAEGDTARIEYRFRNSSIKYPLGEVSFTDTLPDGIKITGLDEACQIDETAAKLTCELGDLDAKSRGRIRIEIEALTGDPPGKVDFRASAPAATFSAYNVMTSFDFTLGNFQKIFSAAEFWDVLKVSVYYTVFGTAGALLFGLFAAQIMQKAFFGRR